MPTIKRMLFLTVFMLFISACPEALAQNENVELIEGGNGGDDPDIPEIPIDGGLSLLLVAGVAYGGKKVHEFRNRKTKTLKNEDIT